VEQLVYAWNNNAGHGCINKKVLPEKYLPVANDAKPRRLTCIGVFQNRVSFLLANMVLLANIY
jgi:hypothetical protein